MPKPGPSTEMPCSSRARSTVGDTTTCGSSENETTPTRSEAGARSRKERIAFFAAARRVGFTSVARIEPDVSTTRTTLARSFGALTVMVGRAKATQSAASEARSSAAGTWRRQARRLPATPASTSRFVYRTANLGGRRCRSQYPVAASGTTTRVASSSGASKLIACLASRAHGAGARSGAAAERKARRQRPPSPSARQRCCAHAPR